MNYDYLTGNYKKFTDDVKRICRRIGRNYEDIKLVAISKTFPSEQVAELFKAGHLDFGENKVQELKIKFEELNEKLIIEPISNSNEDRARANYIQSGLFMRQKKMKLVS